MNIRKICFVLVPVLFFSIVACGDSPDASPISEETYPEGTIEAVAWDTSGGGEVKFTIEMINDDFEIMVESIDGEPVDITIFLTDEEPAVYSLVDDIFEKRINLYDYTFTPIGETGTWTTITLYFSNDGTRDIENIDPSSELHILRDYVLENSTIDN